MFWHCRFLSFCPKLYDSMNLFFTRKDNLNKSQFIINYTLFINGKSGRYAEISFRRPSDEFKRGNSIKGAELLSHAKFERLFDQLISKGNLEIGCEVR